MLYLWPTADAQEPTVSSTHNNTQHTTKKTYIKHDHHVPPAHRLPAALILLVSITAVRWTIDINLRN
jgi:hypothetical protein